MSYQPFKTDEKYTMFDNYLLDEVMPLVTPNGWKVLCFILRKTKGWHKEKDSLSLSQIMTGTGIKNRTTATSAIDDLESKDYILVHRAGDGVSSNTYQLNREYEVETPSTETVPPEQVTSTEIVPGVVQKSYTQKKGKDINTTNTNVLVTSDDAPPEIEQQTFIPEKPKTIEAKAKTVDRPPGVNVYRGIANRFPDKATWPMIAEAVAGDEACLSFWGDVVRAYIACGWSKVNIAGMLDYYGRHEIPTTVPEKRGSNAKDRRSNQGANKPAEWGYNPYTGKNERIPVVS